MNITQKSREWHLKARIIRISHEPCLENAGQNQMKVVSKNMHTENKKKEFEIFSYVTFLAMLLKIDSTVCIYYFHPLYYCHLWN